jgi:Family of unknown function (DUF6544)
MIAIETATPLERLRAFALPGGEAALRRVRGVRLAMRGEIRLEPNARWMPFEAEQTIDARRTAFRWTARLRMGPFGVIPVTVTDAYEGGRGQMVVRVGIFRPARSEGPDFDKGERQRYLAELVLCPPALWLNPALEWTALTDSKVRIRDRAGDGAAVDLTVGEHGEPRSCRADRPRAVARGTVVTPWSGTYGEPAEWQGFRIPTRLEATWHLEDGPFAYVREEVTALVLDADVS